ncbi:hypothetical protein LCGC14_0457030 [marine sediment metagenome]|uniref:Uncharacterized protein n=1 Tax=marine sediment metagenome TaxID=412755 RepID=A0A0F9V335_9ZZZZ|nr:hypothetical protein [Candidatus Aminicenantes bacterium]
MNDMTLPPALSTAVDWLMYKSYEHQRVLTPDRPAESWKKLYMYADEYEAIYQKTLEDQDESTDTA